MNAKVMKIAGGPLIVNSLVLLLPILFCLVPYNLCYGQTGAESSQQTNLTSNQAGDPVEPSSHPRTKKPEAKADTRELSSDKADQETDKPSTPSAANAPVEAKSTDTVVQLRQTEQLVQQFEQLVEDIQIGKKTDADADKLYRELSSTLRAKRSELLTMMRSWQQSTSGPDIASKETSDSQTSQKQPPDDSTRAAGTTKKTAPQTFKKAETLYRDMLALYNIRIMLLESITPELRFEITGVEREGVLELLGEIQQVVVSLRFQTLMSPNIGQRMVSNLKLAPLPVVVKILKLIIIVIIFRWWRRWARQNIPRFYQNLMEARSRRPLVRVSIIFLWYADRLRSPLEWLVLIGLFFQIADPKYIQIVDDILWTQIRWLLLAWFCIAFVSAFAKRGASSFKSQTINLRLKSLRLTIGWLLLLLLTLNFAEDLAGQGTIYAWVWMIFVVLALPVLILLLSWWRPEVTRLLKKQPLLPPWVQSTLKYNTGLKSYMAAVIWIVYLLLNWFRQQILRVITSFEGGRALVASLTQMEATRASEIQKNRGDENPIPTTLRKALLENDGHIIDSFASDALSILTQRIFQGHSGFAVVIAGRGGGKSTLLNRVANETGSKTVIFDCPFGGYEAFFQSFARAIDLDGEDLSADVIKRRLEESGIRMVGIDNVHRLSRPILGGQRDLDRSAELLNSIQAKILWVFTVDRSAWQYISRVRAHTMLLEEVLELPLWNESQIQELIEHRLDRAGIRIDYNRLALPGQYDDIRFETIEERNQAGYFRILWNMSDGNPVFALRQLTESMYMTTADNVVVHIPRQLSTKPLDRMNTMGLLVLRSIVQMDMATPMDITESLKMSAAEVTEHIRFSVNKRWVEEQNGYYYITWDWYLAIRRVLSRQNLMPRRTLGDTL